METKTGHQCSQHPFLHVDAQQNSTQNSSARRGLCALALATSLLMLIFMTNRVYAEDSHINSKTTFPQLLLAGGSLSTCSSYSRDNCKNVEFPSNAKNELLYSVDQASVSRLENFINNALKFDGDDDLLLLLSPLKSIDPIGPINRRGLFRVFDKVGIAQGINELPDAAYYSLLDHLEFAQMSEDGSRVKELANVPATQNQNSLAIYQRFTDEVRAHAKRAGQEAHILVVTSSSRDAFEVSDFYESAFRSLGVKTTWLPIDRALVYALDPKRAHEDLCENLTEVRARFFVYDRTRVYPDRSEYQRKICKNPSMLLELLKSSQGIFFNGGDQSKTLASLFHSDGSATIFWREAMKKVARREMIIGGTSAGTAVHAGKSYKGLPIGMISNGSSEFALKRGVFASLAPSVRCIGEECGTTLLADDLTYMPSGGSGLFSLGTLDTHFSERDREARLISLALETGTALSVGVDETTALLFGRSDNLVSFEVIGEQGVFFVDGGSQVIQKSRNNDIKEVSYAGYSHYLHAGIKASLNLTDNTWKVFSGAAVVTERKRIAESEQGIWRNSIRRYCGSREMTSWSFEDINFTIAPESLTQFFTDANSRHCGYLYLPFVVSASYDLNQPLDKK